MTSHLRSLTSVASMRPAQTTCVATRAARLIRTRGPLAPPSSLALRQPGEPQSDRAPTGRQSSNPDAVGPLLRHSTRRLPPNDRFDPAYRGRARQIGPYRKPRSLASTAAFTEARPSSLRRPARKQKVAGERAGGDQSIVKAAVRGPATKRGSRREQGAHEPCRFDRLHIYACSRHAERQEGFTAMRKSLRWNSRPSSARAMMQSRPS